MQKIIVIIIIIVTIYISIKKIFYKKKHKINCSDKCDGCELKNNCKKF